MTLVRTTKQPGRVLDVDDAELLDLTRMGLILEEVTPEPAAAISTPSAPTSTPPSSPSTAAKPPTSDK